MTPDFIRAVQVAAERFRVPAPNLLACIETESLGIVSCSIEHETGTTTREPIIRWEGHYFDKRLDPKTRTVARKRGLAAPKAGQIKNPAQQQARWDRLLLPAMKINEKAALESISIGVGQVMGAHWDKLGYPSPQEMFANARSDGGINLMCLYCKRFGLIDELQRGDFAGFARGYNGPAYRANRYDSKMLAASRKWAVKLKTSTKVNSEDAAKVDGMLRMGTSGRRVFEAQTLLQRAGFAVKIDGDFGPAMKRAVMGFQERAKLKLVDGIIGPDTWQALEEFKVDPREVPGVPGPVEAVVVTQEGRTGAVVAGAGATIGAAKDAVQGAADKVSEVAGGSSVLDHVHTGLTILVVLLVVAGAAWALYGWWKANQTRGVITEPPPADPPSETVDDTHPSPFT